jgi:hypothetical protein
MEQQRMRAINTLPHASSKKSLKSPGAEWSGGYAVNVPAGMKPSRRTTRGEGEVIVNAQMCR